MRCTSNRSQAPGFYLWSFDLSGLKSDGRVRSGPAADNSDGLNRPLNESELITFAGVSGELAPPGRLRACQLLHAFVCAGRFRSRELLLNMRGMRAIRGQNFPSFLFMPIRDARIHLCSADSVTAPTSRNGIPGIKGITNPAMPINKQLHPINLFRKEPVGSTCCSMCLTVIPPNRTCRLQVVKVTASHSNRR